MKTPVLVGCTASGKTGLLMDFRKRHDFRVISADSRQVYRGMDIGTAKPDAGEKALLPHSLVDLIDPDESFSAGEFARMALELIEGIRQQGGLPLVCGGTALYVMALTGGLDPMPERCSGVREGLRLIEDERPGFMMALLDRVDPRSAEIIGERDARRQTRALELYVLTGRPASELRKGGDPEVRGLYNIVGITVPGPQLRRRISRRTEKMLEKGFIEEVRDLVSEGWGRESALGRTIGYSEVLDYLDGTIGSLDELREKIDVSTWQLARRQRNMFRRIPGIMWRSWEDADGVESLLFREGGV